MTISVKTLHEVLCLPLLKAMFFDHNEIDNAVILEFSKCFASDLCFLIHLKLEMSSFPRKTHFLKRFCNIL